MLENQTIDKLEALGLAAMAAGLADQLAPRAPMTGSASPTASACWSTKRPTPATAVAWPPG